MLHTTSSGQCTGNASNGALVNGVSVTILGVTVIFRVLVSPNEYLLSVVPNIIDPSGLMSLLSQRSTCVSRLNVQRPTSPDFTHSNARFRFVNSQSDVVAIGKTNFNVVAASSSDIFCRFRFAIGK